MALRLCLQYIILCTWKLGGEMFYIRMHELARVIPSGKIPSPGEEKRAKIRVDIRTDAVHCS